MLRFLTALLRLLAQCPPPPPPRLRLFRPPSLRCLLPQSRGRWRRCPMATGPLLEGQVDAEKGHQQLPRPSAAHRAQQEQKKKLSQGRLHTVILHVALTARHRPDRQVPTQIMDCSELWSWTQLLWEKAQTACQFQQNTPTL